MKMNKNIENKLQVLGETLGLDRSDVIRAKRTARNVITMALIAGVFILLGYALVPGAPVGNYYGGGGIKDFQLLFSGLL